MFKFLDKFKKNSMKATGENSTISSDQLFEGNEEETGTNVKTELSIHPGSQVTNEEKYFLQFLHNELPDLKENQISISGVDLKRTDSDVLITAFVRNSLRKSVKFEKTALLLIGPDGERLARKEFDLSTLGELPAQSSRPWQFKFSQAEIEAKEISLTGWKLAFELKKVNLPHGLDLEDSWKKSLADEEVRKLETMVKSLDAPKPGEVNFMGIAIKLLDNGQLHTILLIRNGSEKEINLKQIPLIVEDAHGDVVAKGGFQLEELKVKANTSKPWTFIFPESLVVKQTPDLSKWKVYPITK
ncbi:accessory Sec system S-layer assembly protein [Bacillus sp. AK031]